MDQEFDDYRSELKIQGMKFMRTALIQTGFISLLVAMIHLRDLDYWGAVMAFIGFLQCSVELFFLKQFFPYAKYVLFELSVIGTIGVTED